MAQRFTMGIDLGGTNLKAGVCDEQGTLIAQHAVETQAELGFEAVFVRMVALVSELLSEAGVRPTDIEGIGVGAPGPLSRSSGVIYSAPNLPGWVNVPLRHRLSDATRLPVVLENDANAAAFGEFIAGAGRGVRSLVQLTLGTGVGGGIVLDGRLWHGADDSAGEMGHTILVPGGRPCPCGQAGCFERYCSANAMVGRLTEAIEAGEDSILAADIRAGRSLDAVAVERAKVSGDPLAVRIWDETCYYLALGCITIERMLVPDLIVLAGGLIGAGERLLTPVQEHFARLRWNLTRPATRIVFSTLGHQAGIIGAAMVAREAAGPT
jgi:glucokinase